MPTEIENALETTPEQALERFAHYTRSSAFSLALGVREIRLLKERPWYHAWAMQGSEVAALYKLLEKGMLEHAHGQPPQLSPMGKLVCQLLYLSGHIAPSPDNAVSPKDILEKLAHSASWSNPDPFTWKHVEMRTIDGQPHLVVRVREAVTHAVSEWAIPASAVQRIG